jgi:hypothetical protein
MTGKAMRAAHTLRDDASGAVMIFGIFAAALLVGVLYYVVGVGDAIVHRESLQDAADATAYAAAVYHARGMNIIAMTNLIMAAVLAVMITLRLLQLLITIGWIASCVCAIADLGINVECDTLCTSTLRNAKDEVARMADNLKKPIDCILQGLHAVSTAVALLMPDVAAIRSAFFAQRYQPAADFGVALSVSMLPGESVKRFESQLISGEGKSKNGSSAKADSSAQTDGGSSGGQTNSSTGSCPNIEQRLTKFVGAMSQTRVGLPVQDDDYKHLCKAAGLFIVETLFQEASFFVPPALASAGQPVLSKFEGLVKTFMNWLTSHFSGFFCGLDTPPADALPKDANHADSCTKAKLDQKNKGLPPNQRLTEAQCKKKADIINQVRQEGFKVKAADQGDGSADVPKKVYGPAILGSDYYAIWSVVHGDWDSNAQRGVPIATWGGAHADGPGSDTSISIAEAEFYCDDGGVGEFTFAGGGNDAPQSFPDDAMWNMRWRARLRRVRFPTPEFASLAGPYISKAIDKMQKDLGNAGKLPSVKRTFDDLRNLTDQAKKTIDKDIKHTLADVSDVVVH